MKRALCMLTFAATVGCGLEAQPDGPAASGQSQLGVTQFGGERLDVNLAAREWVALRPGALDTTTRLDAELGGREGQYCAEEALAPLAVATVREVVKLQSREVMTDLGPVVQSALREPNTDYEEVRRGIAEFQIAGAYTRAQLRFDESRIVWPYPVAPDTHRISAYAADLKVTRDDFDGASQTVARFETDVNAAPRAGNQFDVTPYLDGKLSQVGFRFELEGLGMGTQFDSVRLVVTRCRAIHLPD